MGINSKPNPSGKQMTQKSGDFEADLLEQLPRLRRFCFSLTGTQHDADDLLQGTVEKLLMKPPPPGADLTKWMYRVCKNFWIDEIRSRKVRSASPLEESGADAPTGGEADALTRLTFAEVNTAMDGLPLEQRVVLSLVAVEGRTYKEAADILELPVGTVMSRLSRARASMAAQFEKSEVLH